MLAEADDQGVVDAAAAALAIANVDDVRGNLTLPATAAGTEVYQDTVPLTSITRRFLRLRVTAP